MRSGPLLLFMATLALAGCGTVSGALHDRVAAIPPTIAPEPAPAPATGSLWQASARHLALAEDQRASGVGDMVTIVLVERLQSQKSTGQQSKKNSQRGLDLPDAAPFKSIPEGLFSGGSSNSFSGSGSATQENRLSGEFTVFVTSVLPNGAFRIAGDRRITLTRGEEQVQLSGIIRPEDIGPDNRVPSTRVANAVLRYTGTGEIAAQVRQGWLARFFDRISPF